MLKAKPIVDIPHIKGVITPTPKILGQITHNTSKITGVVHLSMPTLRGVISEDVKREAYYEVSNEYGTTIVIGD